MKYDFIIVGQGIAGSMLAWFLHKSGSRVLVVDDFNPNSSSQIASGVINPVTGKRLVKSWRIDEFLPFAKDAYRKIENELNVSLFSKRNICRIFSNNEDFQFFRQKRELEELPEYVKPLDFIPGCFNNDLLGGIEINQAYQLDYPLLLASVRKFLIEKDLLLNERIHFQNLVLREGSVSYNGLKASKMIFCEGWISSENPYFNWLPFNLAKGEVITVKMDGFPEEKIWHKGLFIMPTGNGLCRVGATYEWKFLDDKPAESGKLDLVARLKKAVNLEFEVLQHHAAIRPTVIDRRPLIGVHPRYKELAVFNGLGTKGASLAPFFAHQFSNHLKADSKLDREVDIARFSEESYFPR